MKRDVDLTENGQFTDIWESLGKLDGFIGNPKYPWEFNPLAGSSVEDRNRQLIFTGNYEEIHFKKMMTSLEDGQICERCGRRIISLFDHQQMGLCEQCAKELDDELNGNHWLICDNRNMPITRQMMDNDIVIAFAHSPEEVR